MCSNNTTTTTTTSNQKTTSASLVPLHRPRYTRANSSCAFSGIIIMNLRLSLVFAIRAVQRRSAQCARCVQSSVPHAFSTAYGQRWHTTIFISFILVLFTLLDGLSVCYRVLYRYHLSIKWKWMLNSGGEKIHGDKSGFLGSRIMIKQSWAILRKASLICAVLASVRGIHRDRTRECNKLRSGFTCAFWDLGVLCVWCVRLCSSIWNE